MIFLKSNRGYGNMDNKLNYEIKVKYGNELCAIQNKLQQLESGRIYELTEVKMDGYLSTNIQQLREMICDLLNKIQEGEDGISAELKRASEIMSSIIREDD